MKFSIKDFLSKCGQIPRKLRIWSHLLKKYLIENFNFWTVLLQEFSWYYYLSTKTCSHVSTNNCVNGSSCVVLDKIFRQKTFIQNYLPLWNYYSFMQPHSGCGFESRCSKFVISNVINSIDNGEVYTVESVNDQERFAALQMRILSSSHIFF